MNYKIKVESEAESKEAQELFFELGYGWCGVNPRNSIFIPKKLKEYFIINYEKTKDMQLSGVFDNSETLKTHKEITISELRDLVVLKRNDATDCTHWHVAGKANLPYLFAMDEWYFFGRNGWEKSTHTHEFYNRLKPIEKPMKEYLNPNQGYKLVTCKVGYTPIPSNWIEVPEGAEKATLCGGFLIFWKDEFLSYSTRVDLDWKSNKEYPKTYYSFTEYTSDYDDAVVVWKRETLNDKVASAETARQADKVLKEILEGGGSAWDTQVGGDHYKKYKIQPMEFALKNNLNPLQHSVLKYVMRHEDKNGKQDLEKAKHYIDLMIEYYYGDS